MSAAPIPEREISVTDASGLISSYQWDGDVILFAFADTGEDYPEDYSASGEPGVGFSAFDEDTRSVFRSAFAIIDELIAVDVVETDQPANAEIVAASSPLPQPAYSYLPGNSAAAGDIWFDLDSAAFKLLGDPEASLVGSYDWMTVLHEIGHAFGLKHGHQGSAGNATVLPGRVDGLEYSLMTYRSYVGDPFTGSYETRELNYPQGPMTLDIAALQDLYGANYETRAGDTVYAFDPATGALSVDGAVWSQPAGNIVFRTIWDGGGTDEIDLRAYASKIAIDLRPGQGTDLDVGGTAQRAEQGDGIFALYHVHMSLLHDDDPRSLIENAATGTGDDTLVGNSAANRLDGGGGQDILWGGEGDDTFAAAAMDLIGDEILDFEQGDVIEVTGAAARLSWGASETGTHAFFGRSEHEGLIVKGGAVAGHVVVARSATDGTATVSAFSGGVVLTEAADRFVSEDAAISGVEGGGGDDVLVGRDFDDLLLGGIGSDRLIGSGGADTLNGGPGADMLTGGSGADLFVVGHVAGEADTITDFDLARDFLSMPHGDNDAIAVPDGAALTLSNGALVIFRGLTVAQIEAVTSSQPLLDMAIGLAMPQTWLTSGSDRIEVSGEAAQHIVAQDGDDIVVAAAGDDWLDAGDGADLLIGQAGRDTLDGGPGSDIMSGGDGADMFIIRPEPSTFLTSDTITDFDLATDTVLLQGFDDFDHVAAAVSMTPGGAAIRLGEAQYVVFSGIDAASRDALIARVETDWPELA